MADINDVTRIIADALTKIGMTGMVKVTLDGDHAGLATGELHGDAVMVEVVITPLD